MDKDDSTTTVAAAGQKANDYSIPIPKQSKKPSSSSSTQPEQEPYYYPSYSFPCWSWVVPYLTLPELLQLRLICRGWSTDVHDQVSARLLAHYFLAPVLQRQGLYLVTAARTKRTNDKFPSSSSQQQQDQEPSLDDCWTRATQQSKPPLSWEDPENDDDEEEDDDDMLVRALRSCRHAGSDNDKNKQPNSPLSKLVTILRLGRSIPSEMAIGFSGKYGRQGIPLVLSPPAAAAAIILPNDDQTNDNQQTSINNNTTTVQPKYYYQTCPRRKQRQGRPCPTCRYPLPKWTINDNKSKRNNQFARIPRIHDYFSIQVQPSSKSSATSSCSAFLDLTDCHPKCFPNLPPDLTCPLCDNENKTQQQTLVLSDFCYESELGTEKTVAHQMALTFTPKQPEKRTKMTTTKRRRRHSDDDSNDGDENSDEEEDDQSSEGNSTNEDDKSSSADSFTFSSLPRRPTKRAKINRSRQQEREKERQQFQRRRRVVAPRQPPPLAAPKAKVASSQNTTRTATGPNHAHDDDDDDDNKDNNENDSDVEEDQKPKAIKKSSNNHNDKNDDDDLMQVPIRKKTKTVVNPTKRLDRSESTTKTSQSTPTPAPLLLQKRRRSSSSSFPPRYRDMMIPSLVQSHTPNAKYGMTIYCTACRQFALLAPAGICNHDENHPRTIDQLITASRRRTSSRPRHGNDDNDGDSSSNPSLSTDPPPPPTFQGDSSSWTIPPPRPQFEPPMIVGGILQRQTCRSTAATAVTTFSNSYHYLPYHQAYTDLQYDHHQNNNNNNDSDEDNDETENDSSSSRLKGGCTNTIPCSYCRQRKKQALGFYIHQEWACLTCQPYHDSRSHSNHQYDDEDDDDDDDSARNLIERW